MEPYPKKQILVLNVQKQNQRTLRLSTLVHISAVTFYKTNTSKSFFSQTVVSIWRVKDKSDEENHGYQSFEAQSQHYSIRIDYTVYVCNGGIQR